MRNDQNFKTFKQGVLGFSNENGIYKYNLWISLCHSILSSSFKALQTNVNVFQTNAELWKHTSIVSVDLLSDSKIQASKTANPTEKKNSK